MSLMETTLQVPGPWTIDDLENLPDDGHRYEIIDGVLLVNAAPVPRHQMVLANLFRLLDAACPADWLVLFAPLDIVLARDTVVEPDLLVAPREAFGPKNLPGPPLLAVEVLSPSTRLIDLSMKKERYERAGVPSYWLVDPDELRLVAYELRDGCYVEAADVGPGDTWTAADPFTVSIDPGSLLG